MEAGPWWRGGAGWAGLGGLDQGLGRAFDLHAWGALLNMLQLASCEELCKGALAAHPRGPRCSPARPPARPPLPQDNSLLQMPPWRNPWLAVAMAVSFSLHFLILYVPFLAEVFSIVPLSLNEWLLVLLYSLPVILIDEVLKFVGRTFVNKRVALAEVEARKKEE